MTGTNESITIRNGAQADFASLYEMLFLHVDNNLRKRDKEEINKMMDNDAIFVMESSLSKNFIGICCFSQASDGGYEFGGAYILEEYRRKGLFKCFAIVCFIHHYIATQPSNITAIVLSANNMPISVLKSIGFCFKYRTSIPKTSYTGIDHIKTDKFNNIEIDVYEFNNETILDVVTSARKIAADACNCSEHYDTNIILKPFIDPDILDNFYYALSR